MRAVGVIVLLGFIFCFIFRGTVNVEVIHSRREEGLASFLFRLAILFLAALFVVILVAVVIKLYLALTTQEEACRQHS